MDVMLAFPLILATSSISEQTSSVLSDNSTPETVAGSDDGVRDDDEILVVATPWRGAVDVPQAPVMTLDEADIASYGAASLTELLEAVSPQTSSGRGRGEGGPVILLNGLRISSFREIRDIPPEAIRRMEVLPEEVALRYGYPATQRVVNFILKDNYTGKTIAGEYNIPTRGGFAESELEAGLVKINGSRRFNINAKIEDTSMLTEAQRGVIQPAGNIPTVRSDPDPAAYRSLVDDSRDFTLNGTWSTALGSEGKGGSLSINTTIERSNTRDLLGLDMVRLIAPDGTEALRSLPGALARKTATTSLQGGITFNKPMGRWQLTATADASHSDLDTTVDQEADTSALTAAALAGNLDIDGPLPALSPGGVDRTESKNLALNSLVTLSGNPIRLPAGNISLTVKAGLNHTRSNNSSSQDQDARTILKRDDLSGGINLAIPIASRRENILAGAGDISLNLSAGLNHLSDFGTLIDWSAGITWSPWEKLNLQASYFVDEAAPTLAQLGNPEILTFNRTVYDFTKGETALVTIVTGGNPALRREKQRDIKLAATWELPFLKNSNLIVEYFRNRSNDVTQSFPVLTPAIEAAFPGRVVRDINGRLLSIDQRPVTFSETKSSRLRWGFNLSGTIGQPQPTAQSRMLGDRPPAGGPGAFPSGRPGAAAGGQPGPGGSGPRGPGGFGGPGANGQGRWNISLYHTVRFSEKVVVAADGPILDLLDGDALSGGGVARHALELEGGTFYKGFGLRLTGNWAAPTRVRSSGAPASSDLRFGSVLTLNARLFINFDQQASVIDKIPFAKGMRLSFEFNNILDSRQKVTDPTGSVPLNYQADYLDPRGRFIGIDLRKMF